MPDINDNKNVFNTGTPGHTNRAMKKTSADPAAPVEAQPISTENIKKASQNHAAVIGRSQVSFAGDTFANDMKQFTDNPELAAKANAFGDMVYKKQKDKNPDAYEHAATLGKEFFNELGS